MSAPSEKYDDLRSNSTTALNSDIYLNNDANDNSNSRGNRLATESEDWSSMELFETMPPPYSIFPGAYPEVSASRPTQEHPPQSTSLIQKEDAQEGKQRDLQSKNHPKRADKVRCVVSL